MLRRHELTDNKGKHIVHSLPPENTGKQGYPRKSNHTIFNRIIWIVRNGYPDMTFPNIIPLEGQFITIFTNGLRIKFEQHLVEQLFLKLKAYRHIAVWYYKLTYTYLGFLYCFHINLVKINKPKCFSNTIQSSIKHNIFQKFIPVIIFCKSNN